MRAQGRPHGRPCPVPFVGAAANALGRARMPWKSSSRRLTVSRAHLTSNDFKPGLTIEVEGAPYRVIGGSW